MARVSHTGEAVVVEPGHQERRREQQQLGPGVGVGLAITSIVEVEPGELAQQPAPERPRAVVPAVDGERGLRHGCILGAAGAGCAAVRPVPNCEHGGQFHQ